MAESITVDETQSWQVPFRWRLDLLGHIGIFATGFTRAKFSESSKQASLADTCNEIFHCLACIHVTDNIKGMIDQLKSLQRVHDTENIGLQVQGGAGLVALMRLLESPEMAEFIEQRQREGISKAVFGSIKFCELSEAGLLDHIFELSNVLKPYLSDIASLSFDRCSSQWVSQFLKQPKVHSQLKSLAMLNFTCSQRREMESDSQIFIEEVLPKFESLTSLNLTANRLHSVDQKRFAAVLSRLPLEALDLTMNMLDQADMRVLAGAIPESLAKFHLKYNRIGSAGMVTLAPALPASLAVFDLSGTIVGDAGIQALALELPRLQSIRTLSLFGVGVGDAGLLVLAPALPDSLIKIVLGHNKIGKDGLLALMLELPRLKWLKELDLSDNCFISDKDISSLLEVLPKTSIVDLGLSNVKISDGLRGRVDEVLRANKERIASGRRPEAESEQVQSRGLMPQKY